MSTPFKYIIPLLSKEITSDDLTKEAGFVSACNLDINKPYLDNHIFLIYDDKVLTKKSLDCGVKLKNLEELHNYRRIRIKGRPFTVYCFPIGNKAITRIKDGILSFSNEDRMRILTFWNFKDDDINAFMLNPTDFVINFVNVSVAEEDYQPSLAEAFDKKSGVLVSTPL